MRKLLSFMLLTALLSGTLFVNAETATEVTASESEGNIDAESTYFSGEIISDGPETNAITVDRADALIENAAISSVNGNKNDTVQPDHTGKSACVLVAGRSARITDSAITGSINGAHGVFAVANGIATISSTQIETSGNCAEAIHSESGNIVATNSVAITAGESSPALHSCKGSTVLIEGGSYTTYGTDSPVIRCQGDITVSSAVLTANGSEALSIGGSGVVRLKDCVLTGTMQDIPQSHNTRTVLFGPAKVEEQTNKACVLEMCGGSLNAENGGVFLTHNVDSVITLDNVSILENNECEFLLRCCDEPSGSTEAQSQWKCMFTAIRQTLKGQIVYDHSYDLEICITNGSNFTGMITRDPADTDTAGGNCSVYIDRNSVWIVTDNSYIDSLSCEGILMDPSGSTVSIANIEGSLLVEGTSPYTITVDHYSTVCNDQPGNSINAY